MGGTAACHAESNCKTRASHWKESVPFGPPLVDEAFESPVLSELTSALDAAESKDSDVVVKAGATAPLPDGPGSPSEGVVLTPWNKFFHQGAVSCATMCEGSPATISHNKPNPAS